MTDKVTASVDSPLESNNIPRFSVIPNQEQTYQMAGSVQIAVEQPVDDSVVDTTVGWVDDPKETTGFLTSLELRILKHPKDINYPEIVNNHLTLINTIKELDFLKGIPINAPHQSHLVGNSESRQLMELLNAYSIGLGWSCNPGRGNTTAYFKLLYLGGIDTLPEEYNINQNVTYVAIVELTSSSGPVVYSLAVG